MKKEREKRARERQENERTEKERVEREESGGFEKNYEETGARS